MQTHLTISSPEAVFQLITAADLVPVPWKNGGGITRQIAIYPEDAGWGDFVWRVSAAVVERAGPFSIFNGIDRFIVVTHGASTTLIDADDQSRHNLPQGQVLTFPGEAALSAELPDGPIHDFNLMVRRGKGLGELAVRQARQRLDLAGGSTILHCTGGVFNVSRACAGERSYRLVEGDSLQISMPAGYRESIEIAPEQPGSSLMHARIRHSFEPPLYSQR